MIISIVMLCFSLKMKVLCSFASYFTLLLFFTATAQEPAVEFLHLHDPTAAASPEYHKLPTAVLVQSEHLYDVSNSVLMAESWLKTHVLAHYPRVNITAVLAGHNVLCDGDEKHRSLDLVLPSLKNIHYSLTRWGLENEIKVAASFSDSCLDSGHRGHYRGDLAQGYIKPLLLTLKEMNSPYILSPNLDSGETLSTLKSHYESMKNLGDLHLLDKIIAITEEAPKNPKPFTRKLSSFTESDAITPLPPLIGTVIPPQPSFTAPSLAPEPILKSPHLLLPPMANPSSPPYGPHLPPCEPSVPTGAPRPVHDRGGVWCVAKPSVPTETLQLALDYACGEGGADCEAIQPHGSCFYPDNVLSHASYAFNSYWQKAKKHGGSCGFSGTAMLLNSDPSYGGCRFVLA